MVQKVRTLTDEQKKTVLTSIKESWEASETAKALGLNKPTMYRRLRKTKKIDVGFCVDIVRAVEDRRLARREAERAKKAAARKASEVQKKKDAKPRSPQKKAVKIKPPTLQPVEKESISSPREWLLLSQAPGWDSSIEARAGKEMACKAFLWGLKNSVDKMRQNGQIEGPR